jgi:hypothetical protein
MNRRMQGFSLIAIVMVAAGIGPNTVVLSVVNAAPLNPCRSHNLMDSCPCTPAISAAPVRLSRRVVFLDYADLRDRADVLSGLIAYWRQSVRMKRLEQAEAFITADIADGRFYFSALEPRALIERRF